MVPRPISLVSRVNGTHIACQRWQLVSANQSKAQIYAFFFFHFFFFFMHIFFFYSHLLLESQWPFCKAVWIQSLVKKIHKNNKKRNMWEESGEKKRRYEWLLFLCLVTKKMRGSSKMPLVLVSQSVSFLFRQAVVILKSFIFESEIFYTLIKC